MNEKRSHRVLITLSFVVSVVGGTAIYLYFRLTQVEGLVREQDATIEKVDGHVTEIETTQQADRAQAEARFNDMDRGIRQVAEQTQKANEEVSSRLGDVESRQMTIERRVGESANQISQVQQSLSGVQRDMNDGFQQIVDSTGSGDVVALRRKVNELQEQVGEMQEQAQRYDQAYWELRRLASMKTTVASEDVRRVLAGVGKQPSDNMGRTP